MDSVVDVARSIVLHKWRILAIFLALVSVSIAHYAGFIMHIPTRIVAVSGATLIPGVTAIFLFYLSLSTVVSRVFFTVILPFVWLAVTILSRFSNGLVLSTFGNKKGFVSSCKGLVANEGLLSYCFQALMSITLMFGLYTDFSFSWRDFFWGCGAFSLFLFLWLLRSGFVCQPNWSKFCLKFKKRQSVKFSVIASAFVTGGSLLVVASFFLGMMRAEQLRSAKPVNITSVNYTGVANVLASTGSATLITGKDENGFWYIYATKDMSVLAE